MDHAVKKPLGIYFFLAPKGEIVKLFGSRDVSEYRLDGPHASRIDTSTCGCIEDLSHPGRIIDCFSRCFHIKDDNLPGLGRFLAKAF
jgi:hypothetical protein